MSDLQERALAYLKGELSAEDVSQFEAELERSEDARGELHKSRELLDLLNAANEESIVRRVDRQIEQAVSQRATDIHIVPERRSVGVWLRIDGNLRELERFDKGIQEAVVDRWKLMAGCNLDERRLPQDGNIAATILGRDFDLRANVLPTVYGERVTTRILDRREILLGLDKLGLSETQLAAVKSLAQMPRGFVFTSGSTGNGKTTLLYSMLLHLLSPELPRRNIMTVEDPVEYAFDGMTQIGVNKEAGLTFAAALRAIRHADPDVVHVAEMRDLESSELSTELALTGHLVLSVLHTPSALLIPQRFLDIGVAPHLIPPTMNGLIGQRLVRQNCPSCLVEYEPSQDELRHAGLMASDGPFRRGAGCEACAGTGVQGRLGLFEVVVVDEPLRALMTMRMDFPSLWEATLGKTKDSLWHDGRKKVRQGLTTVERVNRVLFDYPVSGEKA
jgi:Type II secretory pathway, ATPase PulE/Tfp pilus assembly pathway, ATPase PilB